MLPDEFTIRALSDALDGSDESVRSLCDWWMVERRGHENLAAFLVGKSVLTMDAIQALRMVFKGYVHTEKPGSVLGGPVTDKIRAAVAAAKAGTA